jgi:hypothetical protein
MLAQINAEVSKDHWYVINEFLKVWQLRPTRSESLGYAALHARLHANFALATMLARQASMIKRPPDRMQVEASWYTWRSLDEFAISATHLAAQIGDEDLLKEGLEAMLYLTKQSFTPVEEKARIQANAEQIAKHFGVEDVD